jgi:uncharacterized membrane protein YkvA (DUF1232 family)
VRGGLSPKELGALASAHVVAASEANRRNALVNLRLAQAIANVIEQILSGWDNLESRQIHWLAGAILYFSRSSDVDEPDFGSPIGFEDDAEILNACLRIAGLEHLAINPEDYDDV